MIFIFSTGWMFAIFGDVWGAWDGKIRDSIPGKNLGVVQNGTKSLIVISSSNSINLGGYNGGMSQPLIDLGNGCTRLPS